MSDLGSTVPVREGLPANYRMRADAHYVDQLEMRRVTADDTRPLASSPVVAAPQSPSRHDHASINDDELTRSLTSVLSCTDLLSEGMPRLTRKVAVDMIRVETLRALCAVRAAGVLKHGVSEERRLVTPRAVVERIAVMIEPDTRLRGSRLVIEAAAADDTQLRINEDAVVSGIAGVVMMMSAGLNDVHGAQLDLVLTKTASGRLGIAVRQESVILPEPWLKAANARGDHPFTPAVLPLVALRQIAESHGGSLAITRLPHGTQVAIELAAHLK